MKIVLASARRVTMPPTRGDTSRVLQFARQLSVDHDVFLVSPGAGQLGAALDSTGITAVEPDAGLPRPGRLPLQALPATRWRIPASLIEGADVVHLSTVRSVPLVDDGTLARCHVDFVDAISENMRLRSQVDRLRSVVWRREARALRRLERRVAAAAATTSAISSPDADLLGPKTALVPNGVTVPHDESPRAEAPTIVFAGNLGYYPNVEAAAILAQRILPIVRRTLPGAQLDIVGARPPRSVRRLTGESVRVTADVPSLTPYLHSAWVIAAPVQRGTGVQTKVLEGMAHGRPVVTTTAVATRIEHARIGRDLLAADDDEQLAEAIVHLLEDTATAAVMGQRGRDLVRSHYSWAECTAQLVAAYRITGSTRL